MEAAPEVPGLLEGPHQADLGQDSERDATWGLPRGPAAHQLQAGREPGAWRVIRGRQDPRHWRRSSETQIPPDRVIFP